MAEKRKLQAEIDRVLKKVAEGVEDFEAIWEKVHSAQNGSQKEKYEADLKKEIKKLQRLRDQIKTWLASNDIKDKSELMKNRKLIETQMERFKVVERETKTKTFSKEGLSMAAKMDPAEKAKMEVRDWINSCTERLNMQIDQFEAEIEQLNGKRKKKTDRVLEDRKSYLEGFIENHRGHEQKLELVLRLLDNDTLTTDDVQELHDDVEYYIDNNQEADYEENPYIYDVLPVDLQALIESEEAEESILAAAEDELEQEKEKKLKETKEKEKVAEKPPARASGSSVAPPAPVPTPAPAPASAAPPTPTFTATPSPAPAPAPAAPPKTTTAANVLPPPRAPVAASPVIKTPVATTASPPALPIQSPSPPTQSPSQASFSSTVSASTPATVTATPAQPSPAPAQPPAPFTPGAPTLPSPSTASAPPQKGSVPYPGLPTHPPDLQLPDQLGRQDVVMSGLLASFNNMPVAVDSERSKGYVARNPVQTPSYYPQVAASLLDKEMDADTLFFIFYYQPGTYQQYVAARELKKQSWRFHKKYSTWFQRHEEPKTITDEYEQGTYVYFDYESGWCQRKKTDFTFEYRFLEDQDLP